MTRLLSLSSILSAAAVLGLMAAVPGAEAKSVRQCRGENRAEVIKCCDQMIRTHKPLWMIESGSSCSAAAQCTVKYVPGTSVTHVSKPKKVVVCSIVPPKVHDGGEKPHDPPPPAKTTPNDPPPRDPIIK